MSNYRDEIRIAIGRERCGPLPRGARAEGLSLIMTDRPERPDWAPPSIHRVTPDEARELAYELLAGAELLERSGGAR